MSHPLDDLPFLQSQTPIIDFLPSQNITITRRGGKPQ